MVPLARSRVSGCPERQGRLRGLAVVVVLAAAALTACLPSSDAGIGCAWKYRADKDTLNVAYPDTGAVYWITRYVLWPGQKLTVSGAYPFARYFSFITYSLNGNAVEVATDRDIAPEPGSTNPFSTPGAPTDPNLRRYSVTLDPNAAVSPGDNMLAAGPSPGGIATGTLIMRVYVPDDPNDFTGGVGLPQVTVSNFDGSVRSVATCPNHIGDSSIASLVGLFGPATNAPPQPLPTFVRPLVTSALYANPDNQYLSAIVEHMPGEVVVVRGQAPTFPDTRDGDPVMSPAQVRYWSMCTNEYAKPYRVTDCAADHETEITPDGRYTYVISTPADRPANAGTANGVTWLDWGRTTADGVLLMRHMLPDPSFAESIMSVPPGEPATATMGTYAPMGVYCAKATFEAGGAAACGLP